MSQDTGRNLLSAVLAVGAGLIDKKQFLQACTLWDGQKHKTLVDILLDQGWLSRQDLAHIETLIEQELQRDIGNVASSKIDATTAIKVAPTKVVETLAPKSLVEGSPPSASDGARRDPVVAFANRSADGQRYTLARLYAKGGIGRVWLAQDDNLAREVALKELLPEYACSEAARTRFLKEAKITGQLQHPNIVPVYELSEHRDQQQPFYTMRLIRGRTFADAIQAYHCARRTGAAAPLDLRELLNAYISVCNALAYAHARGVVHRDLKPQNVVLGDFGEVIVLDWGLAKVVGCEENEPADPAPVSVDKDRAHDETVQGQLLGTPLYMSPEQLEGSTSVTPRSDVYALGVILYEILTGERPFRDGPTVQIIMQQAQDWDLWPQNRRRDVPRPLQAVCLKALAKRPADRYASAKELADEVRNWLADEPVHAYPCIFARESSHDDENAGGSARRA